MSTNTEIIQASYAALACGDTDTAMKLFSPAIEWICPDGIGHEEVGKTKTGLGQAREFGQVFSDLRSIPKKFIELDDHVLAIGMHHIWVPHSGQICTLPFVHSWRLADGKVTHFVDYHNLDDARKLFGTNGARMNSREQILQLGLSFWNAKALLVAVELGVFTALSDQPLDAETLRVKLGLHDRGATDFFDALVALGLLDRVNDLYRNTPAAAAALAEPSHENYMGDFLRFMDNHYRSWENLKSALQTGLPQNRAEGGKSELFDMLYVQPEPLRNFLRAMAAGALGTIRALTERFPWERYTTVADVGCASGALLSQVLRRHPRLSGIGLDLPPISRVFAETVEQSGLIDRMRFVAGNFLSDPLPKADVIVFGHVLHDWDLETRRILLEKAYETLPQGGAVIIYEFLIDDDRRRNAVALLMSLNMLLVSSGGSNYTGADCLGWLSDAGFHDCYIEHLWGPDSMVVGRK